MARPLLARMASNSSHVMTSSLSFFPFVNWTPSVPLTLPGLRPLFLAMAWAFLMSMTLVLGDGLGLLDVDLLHDYGKSPLV